MPKVSICIPAYEQSDNLNKCLQSIEMQTFKDFEIIITDDSKSNEILNIVNSFKDKVSIKYYKNVPAKGSPENWNESIKHAIGKYIKILHHDDYFYKEDSLEKLVGLLDENPESKVVFCSSRHVDSSYKSVSSHILKKENMLKVSDNPNILFMRNLIGAPSIMMYHRDVNIYFDKRMKWLVDLDFYIQILKKNSFVYTKEELVCINIIEENRITYQCRNNKEINIYEHIILLNKLGFDKLPVIYKYYLFKLFIRFDFKSFDEIKKFELIRKKNDFKILFFIVKLLSPIYKLRSYVRTSVLNSD